MRPIDADKFKERIQQQITEYFTSAAGGYMLAEDVIDDLDAFPTEDVVEVVHGTWLPGKYEFMERSVCSVCEAVFEGGDNWNYCPKCGAKMDGGME
jgi:rubrerythrin